MKLENTLCFSSVDIYSLIKGTVIAKNGRVFGTALKQYCSDLASVISSVNSSLSNSEFSEIVNLSELCLVDDCNLEYYDGKFDVAVNASGFSEFLTVLLW